ncbi:hypothetical protein L1049_016136 [Liquidambar formosana]|uniref:DUF7787 domain-containing protein n=1 Tax=Liquidambar formosana TaxID=63359 RepID=A0AAP0S0S9_LIQFO
MRERKSKLGKTKIRLEDYHSFLENPYSKDITNEQLNQIIQMNGFIRLHRRPKKELLDALSTVHLITPQRSTLNETVSPYGSSPTIDQVNGDLDALTWQEYPVQSIENINDHHIKSNGGDDLKDTLVNFQINVRRPRSKTGRKRRTKWRVDEGSSNGGAGGGDITGFADLSPLRLCGTPYHQNRRSVSGEEMPD